MFPNWPRRAGLLRKGLPSILIQLCKRSVFKHFRQGVIRQSQEMRHIVGFHGSGKEISLPVAAPQVAQQVVLLACFDSFGNHIHLQSACQFDNGADNVKRLIAGDHARDKRAVDLEHIEWKRVQVIERTVPCSEIIHQQRDAKSVQASQHIHGCIEVGDQTGLCHLEAELAAGDAGPDEQ